MKKIIFIFILIFSLIIIGSGAMHIMTMYNIYESAKSPMNVSLISYYSITISNQLAQGIFFTNSTGAAQNVQYPLISGSFDNNGTVNYNKTNSKTDYWVLVNGVVMVDICNGAKYNLCSNLTCYGATNVEINIGNVTWSSSNFNNIGNPSISSSIPMILGYDNSNKIVGIVPGSDVYLRYWFDVPANSPPYNYSTIYQIQAVPRGYSCA